jgi:drug/metabolite transporter (DMT)-like permease
MNLTSIAKTRSPLVIIGLGALLGSTSVWTKLLTEYMTTMQIVTSRVALASLTMFALLAVRGELRRPSWALLRGAVLLSVFDSLVPYTLMAFGARQVEAGLGAVLIATMPLFTTVFAVLLFREERLSATKLGALAVGFVGVVIIAAPKGLSVSSTGLQSGIAAFLAASVSLGASTVYGRRLLKEARALEVSAWKLAGASVLVVPVMLVKDGTPDASAFAAGPLLAMLFVGVVSTGLARMAYLWASGVIGSTSVSLVTYVMPGAGLIMARLVLGEQPAPTTIAGLALIFVSLTGVMPSAHLATRWPSRSRREYIALVGGQRTATPVELRLEKADQTCARECPRATRRTRGTRADSAGALRGSST